jgi:tetratricopeptide (TPR) repeat protein
LFHRAADNDIRAGSARRISNMATVRSIPRSLAAALGIAVLCLAPDAAAGKRTFEKEYTYRASDIDSKVTSRQIALEQVKRMLLEELGTYLVAETEAKDFRLSKDRITVLTAGFVQTEVLAEKWDGMTYYVKARITADPQELARSLAGARTDGRKGRELEETNRKVDEALRKIQQLQDEIAAGKRAEGRQSEYLRAVDDLAWKEWIDRGVAFMNAEQYQDALNAFLKAAEIRPDDPWAYIDAGWALNSLGDHMQALKMLNKAGAMDPGNPWVYVNRASSYNFLGNFSQALQDAEKAVGLVPNDFWPYFERGWAYIGLGRYDQALADLNRAAQADPKNTAVYRMRAWAHSGRGDKREAMADLDRSVELDPKSSWTYWNRAAYFALNGDGDRALKELAHAIQLNSALKLKARTDHNFRTLWSDGDFRKLTD